MFGLFRDPKKKKLEKFLSLCARGDPEVQTDLLKRIKSAAAEFTEPFENVETFEELKFALRTDQADAVADKAGELQKAMRAHPLGTPVDEMVFFFVEASLRHKAGHRWVGDKEVKLIDQLFSVAERTEI